MPDQLEIIQSYTKPAHARDLLRCLKKAKYTFDTNYETVLADISVSIINMQYNCECSFVQAGIILTTINPKDHKQDTETIIRDGWVIKAAMAWYILEMNQGE